ncbi:ABC-three component system protein [Azohydromonas lata]|uniref:ABC-three component system protein n=1 Tax=Azohydromonas lata TaxID=45677 RepID=UPI001472137F|nr:ABC-three component system protein [Azohydromonas lata]
MRRKLNLLRSDAYAFHIATLYLSEMLIGYLDGREHHKWIGSEQGKIPEWDDFVIECHDGSFRHAQVKRQTTDFCINKTIRVIKKGGSELQELSELDKSISKLAVVFTNGQLSTSPKRSFFIEVPHPTQIKQDLPLRVFSDFCSECRKMGVSAKSLEERALSDTNYQRIYSWLTTWCGFADWQHILFAAQRIHIRYRGTEEDVTEVIHKDLSKAFNNPEEVARLIRSYLQDNATDVGATEPRLIAPLIDRYIKPDFPKWTTFWYSDSDISWHISGTACGHETEAAEPTKSIVENFWRPTSRNMLKLMTNANFPVDDLSCDSVEGALVRLALHASRSTAISFVGHEGWRVGISKALANTLGAEKNDVGDIQWTKIDSLPQNQSCRSLGDDAQIRNEALCMSASMDLFTWSIVRAKVTELIRELPSDGDLRPAVTQLWQHWQKTLDSDPAEHSKLLLEIVHPACEGEDVYIQGRVGPRTADLLACAVWLALVIAAAHGDLNSTWNDIGQGNTLKTIGLRYWGGPAGSKRKARELIDEDSEDTVLEILSKESASFLAFSQVRTSAAYILKSSLADDALDQDSLAAPKRPKALITNSRDLSEKIRQGLIMPLKAYLASHTKHLQTRSKNIEQTSRLQDEHPGTSDRNKIPHSNEV